MCCVLCVCVLLQTRNPTHAGHAYLMRTSRDILKAKGFNNPILWLSPLGGWTKSDDVPLDVRVKQVSSVLSKIIRAHLCVHFFDIRIVQCFRLSFFSKISTRLCWLKECWIRRRR